LRVDGADFQRLGHLRPIAMPGGDKAAREPWRMAAAALAMLGRGDEIATRFAAQTGAGLIAQMLTRTPPASHQISTTSMGRYFDAAAGLLGITPVMSFEAQAAMQLEGLAAKYGDSPTEDGLFELADITTPAGTNSQIDVSPLLARLADCRDVAYGAALFHAVLITALADWVALAAERTGIRVVAGGGGCFLNAVLLRGLQSALAKRGLRFYTNQNLPCGDGGLALGQAWVAQRTAL
jgi:hydrogenase maturation protein HypF